MYIVLNDSQGPESTIRRAISFPVFSSLFLPADLRLTPWKGTGKVYKTERILIKQMP